MARGSCSCSSSRKRLDWAAESGRKSESETGTWQGVLAKMDWRLVYLGSIITAGLLYTTLRLSIDAAARKP
jgi:hypothetical protein